MSNVSETPQATYNQIKEVIDEKASKMSQVHLNMVEERAAKLAAEKTQHLNAELSKSRELSTQQLTDKNKLLELKTKEAESLNNTLAERMKELESLKEFKRKIQANEQASSKAAFSRAKSIIEQRNPTAIECYSEDSHLNMKDYAKITTQLCDMIDSGDNRVYTSNVQTSDDLRHKDKRRKQQEVLYDLNQFQDL